MMRGFYNLTSGMLSQGRRLDVIAHNMTNISTPGYKTELYTDRTFDEVMVSRIGNKIKTPYETFETYQSHILAPDHLYTDFTQSYFEETNLPLDFAINGEGFFAIQMADDSIAYTRAGSFMLDEEGYLCLDELGRVLDPDGEPIQLPTDNISADEQGILYDMNHGYLAELGIYRFEDNGELERNAYGLFTGEGAEVSEDAKIMNRWIERANVDMVREMVQMISTQRALQSAAQMSKIYDEVIQRAVNDIGRMQ